MLGLKNAVFVEVFDNTMGQRLMHLNNAEWGTAEDAGHFRPHEPT